jgi:Family of unknown function (DUF5994)
MAVGPVHHALRLKLKPKAPASGHVDGAWWPRALDLPTELPALVEVLAVRLGHVERVSYHLGAWDAAPRRIDVDGRLLRLGAYRSQNPHTVDVIGSTGRRITLLVLAPSTAEATAHQVLRKAARRDNVDGIDELLAPIGAAVPPQQDRYPTDAAVDRWEVDGGRLYAGT